MLFLKKQQKTTFKTVIVKSPEIEVLGIQLKPGQWFQLIVLCVLNCAEYLNNGVKTVEFFFPFFMEYFFFSIFPY